MALITDPALIFTVMIGITLVVPLLAERLRVPDLVMLLLAGAVMGPHGLGLLERNAAIMLFSSVGLLYIMFLAGLEIDLPKFLQSYDRSIIFGLLTFAIPQGVGTLLGRYVLFMDWPQAILMASMFASHTLLAYPVASRLGIVRTEPVAVTIGATIITDILALMVLAVIADSAKGVDLNLMFWIKILFSLLVLILVGWWGIPWLSRWFFRNNSENGIAQFLFVLGVLCAFSYASHYARMEPIIGAFLAGIAFNQMIPRQSTLMNRVEFVGHAIFIPFFLISVGMLVNLGDLARDPQSWLVAGTMICGVIVTKYCAAQLARFFFGYTRQEGQVMFGLSVVQAAATLAAALVGYELGIFGESVLNGAIGMILVTCPLGSWAVDRYGRQMVARVAAPASTRARGEQRILVPVVNPAGATHLLDLAFFLRDTQMQNILHPMTIIPDEADTATALDEGEKLMAHCLTHAASAEISITPGVRIGMNISDGIIRAAKEMRADVVMLGWGTERTVATRIFGSIRKRMLQECPSRLLFCRLVMPLNTTRRLLLPLPPQAKQRTDIYDLIGEAKRLAKELGAVLHVYLCDPAAAETLRDMIERTAPDMPVTLLEHPDWVSAREQLFRDITNHDMALLPVERRLGAFWTPSLDRLPDVLAARFPEMNLLAAYPALHDAYTAGYEVHDAPGLGKIVPISLYGAPSLDEALKRLSLGTGAWGTQEQQQIFQLLQNAAAAYPVEMAPGTALLHAHSDIVSETTLLVGTSGTAWSFPGLDTPASIVLVLISPKYKSPEIHLTALAQLARAFRDSRIADRIHELTSADEAARMLRESVRNLH